MSQKILKILRREGKTIGCVFDSDLLIDLSPSKLSLLLNQLNQIGNVRKSVVIFSKQLSKDMHEYFISRGLQPIIVPSDKDIYIALETLWQSFFSSLDVICLGTCSDDLLPVVITIRETHEIILVSPNQAVADKYLPYVDYLLLTEQL